jgi:hypothetical protein
MVGIVRSFLMLTALSLGVLVGITTGSRSETVDVKYRGPVDLTPFACDSIERSSFIQRVCYDHENAYMIVSLNGTYYHYATSTAPRLTRFWRQTPWGGSSTPLSRVTSIAGLVTCQRTDEPFC